MIEFRTPNRANVKNTYLVRFRLLTLAKADCAFTINVFQFKKHNPHIII